MEEWRRGGDDPFDVFFQSAPIMMQSLGADGKILRVSHFWADSLGFSVDEMEGQQVTQFMSRNSRIHAESLSIAQHFRRGRLYNAEYEFVRKDGSILAVLMSAVGQHTSDGTFLRSLVILFDNTEVKRTMALLNQKQRAEALGRLVTGVAHDFSNVLSVIQGSLEMLEEDPDRSDRDTLIHDAQRMVSRGAALTDQLLTFARQAHLTPMKVDLNQHVTDSSEMLRRFLPETIGFETVTSSSVWPVRLDMHQFDNALLNLIGNAVDAMHGSGKITVETSNIFLTSRHIKETLNDIQPGRYVMLAVSDTGDGIPPEDMDRVFEPFYTTKPQGVGSGMGLAMVQGFVKQSRGMVNLFSELGYGTTVRLYFPAVGGVQRDDTWHDDPALTGTSGQDDREEILVVEDDDAVRKIMVAQLRSKGYRVAEAANGDIAITLIGAGFRPQLLITDMVMPGLIQGATLARKAREFAPGLKVIAVSGYITEGQSALDPEMAAFDTRLSKPVPRAILMNAVSNLLSKT